MGNGTANLRTPSGVAIGREAVFLAFLGRDCVRKGFDVRGIWLMEIHMDGFLVEEQEGYVKIMCGMDILQDIQCGFHVSRCRMHEIGG